MIDDKDRDAHRKGTEDRKRGLGQRALDHVFHPRDKETKENPAYEKGRRGKPIDD